MGLKAVPSVKHSCVLHAVFDGKATHSVGEMSYGALYGVP